MEIYVYSLLVYTTVPFWSSIVKKSSTYISRNSYVLSYTTVNVCGGLHHSGRLGLTFMFEQLLSDVYRVVIP
jgi:hypothetical protein